MTPGTRKKTATSMSKPRPAVAEMVESIVGCKWSVRVLALVRKGVRRPGAMQRQTAGLTTKVLNERLAKMIRFKILDKTVFQESPPRVEYELTPFGRKFVRILDAIDDLDRERAD